MRFCQRFLKKRDRTVDQMIQAARSGKQNILEASRASGTSKETEIMLINVARASLEELLEERFGADFLRYKQETPMFIPGLSSYRSPKSLEVDLRAMKTEVKRLLFACLLPLAADSVAHLRTVPNWPHWFWLP